MSKIRVFFFYVVLVAVLAVSLVGLDFLQNKGTLFFSITTWVSSTLPRWIDRNFRLIEVCLSLFIIPYVTRTWRNSQEQGKMIKRKLDENTGVVVFGLFDGQIQSDFLGAIKTAFLGDWLFDLIVDWNDKASPNLITASTDYEAAALCHAIRAQASPFILQTERIDCYFENAERKGTPHYHFARLVVALARPDAHKLQSEDYPRIIVIEEGHLRAIHESDTLLPQEDTMEARTWMETLKQLAKAHFAPAGKRSNSITILEIPMEI